MKKITLSAILKADKELDRIDTKFQWARWKARKSGLGDAIAYATRYIASLNLPRGAEYLALRDSLIQKNSRTYTARTVRHAASERVARKNTAYWMPKPERYVFRRNRLSLTHLDRNALYRRA